MICHRKDSQGFLSLASFRYKRGLSTPPVLLVLILIAVGVLSSVVYFKYTAHVEAEEQKLAAFFEEGETSVAKELDTATSYLKDTLSNTGGFCKVYGADNSFLFTLHPEGSTRPIEEIPQRLAVAVSTHVLQGEQELIINRDMWYAVQKGETEGRTLRDLTDSTLFGCFINSYCVEHGKTMSDEQRYFLSLGLSDRFTRDDIIRYFAITGYYDGIQGVVQACEQLFGKVLAQLSDNQLIYLAYCFGNKEAYWEDFCAKFPSYTGGAKTAAAFGLTAGGDTYWLVKQWVESELREIVGARMNTEMFSVGITVDPVIQVKLQSELDTALSSAVGLERDGNTTIDGTVYFTKTNGGTVALIGSRSINSCNTPVFLKETSVVGIYSELYEYFKKDKAHQTSYAKVSAIPGETGAEPTYLSIQQMANLEDLSCLSLVPTVEAEVELTELADFFANLKGDGCYIVNTVADQSGNTVYKRELVGKSDSEEWASSMLSCMIEDNVTATSGRFLHESNRGIYWSTYNNLYCLGGILGTNVFGKELSAQELELLQSTSLRLDNVAASMFANSLKTPLDSTKTMGELLSVSDRVKADKTENSLLFNMIVEDWVSYLKSTPIVSRSSRISYELKYEEFMTTLSTWVSLIEDVTYSSYEEQLVSARAMRGAELLKYAN